MSDVVVITFNGFEFVDWEGADIVKGDAAPLG